MLAQEKMLLGKELPETPVYQEVTDFTNSLNQISIYKALDKKDYAKALEINEYAISCKQKSPLASMKVLLHKTLHSSFKWKF